MAKDLILTKESSESEIKAYFNAVLKLSQSDNEFPINLDDVWPLVYQRRDNAVRSLKDSFMENVDYQALLKNEEQDCLSFIAQHGGSNKVEYYLTISCMEFFIARKVRPVFEVYRKVFHGVAQGKIGCKPKQKREPSPMSKMRLGLEWIRNVSDMLNLNDSSKLLLLGKIAEPLELPLPDYTPSKGVLLSATELLKRAGSSMSAREFNKAMKAKGFMSERTRKSSNGEKKFNVLNSNCSDYGENQVNPQNPKETQPLYYEDKFSTLLSLLN